MKLVIDFSDSDEWDVVAVLRDIAAQVEDGLTSGIYPTWKIEG